MKFVVGRATPAPTATKKGRNCEGTVVLFALRYIPNTFAFRHPSGQRVYNVPSLPLAESFSLWGAPHPPTCVCNVPQYEKGRGVCFELHSTKTFWWGGSPPPPENSPFSISIRLLTAPRDSGGGGDPPPPKKSATAMERSFFLASVHFKRVFWYI